MSALRNPLAKKVIYIKKKEGKRELLECFELSYLAEPEQKTEGKVYN